MNEIDPLEKQLHSWIPRRPSPEVRERLFGKEPRVPVVPSHVWNWLTPAAACALTLLVAVTNHRAPEADEASGAATVTSLMYDPESSNTPRSFVLSRTDLNVEWNAWPRLRSWRPLPNTLRLIPTATNRSRASADL